MSTQEIYKFFIIILILLNIYCVSAIRINEVNARTSEYVEIYNENNAWLNLSEWKIKDNTTSINNLTCYNIANCSLLVNFSYFIIIGRNLNITNIISSNINYFYTDKNTIGSGLNDDGDTVTFFNSTFSSSFDYSSSHTNKSWQFYNNSWQECEPTPGMENYCPQNTAANITQQNSTTNTANSTKKQEIIISLDYDSEVYNSEEFSVKLEAENLENYDYDVKIWLEDDENIISEIYDTNEKKWVSGIYYIDEVLSGQGKDSKTFSIRLNKENKNFTGKADIYARLRKSNSGSYKEESDSIKFIKRAEKQNITSNITNSRIASINNSEDIIKLGKDIKTYKSRAEYIKEYSLFGFTFLLAVILILIITWKKKKVQEI